MVARLLFAAAALCSAAAAQNFIANAASANGGSSVPTLQVRAPRMLPGKHDEILLRANGYIPLGAESFALADGKHTATIMALAETPDLGDVLVFARNAVKHVVTTTGEQLTRLPSHITFRVTASSIVPISDKPEKLECKTKLEEFLRRLNFVARVHRRGELNSEIIQPTSVRLIGIPQEIAAAERVYRAAFDFGPLTVEDHIVLEVNDPDGAPVTKFFLQLK